MRRRFYILFVSRDENGELRKIHIPLHYLYVFIAGAMLGMLTITGIAGSYTRMAIKVARFNQLRSEKDQLRSNFGKLEQQAREKDLQVASLGSLASEVSALYGLKSQPLAELPGSFTEQQLASSVDQLYALKRSALTGATAVGITSGLRQSVSISEWARLQEAPSLWPVDGRITGPFGARIDPFNGEGAFHRGVDISAAYGLPVIAPADGVVSYADFMNGYGRTVVVDHGYGISTRYAHLSAFSVSEGQHLSRGDRIGFVGSSGRSTGSHLHYEVWVHNTPVNPYKYLRTTLANLQRTGGH